MNIQVFGTKKSFDTKKAQRYFKDRRVRFQFVDLKEKGMSKGEPSWSPARWAASTRSSTPRRRTRTAWRFSRTSRPTRSSTSCWRTSTCLAEPVVRNGRQATVGYAPDVWKGLGVARRSSSTAATRRARRSRDLRYVVRVPSGSRTSALPSNNRAVSVSLRPVWA